MHWCMNWYCVKVVYTASKLCVLSGDGCSAPSSNACGYEPTNVEYINNNNPVDFLFGYLDGYNGNITGIGFAYGG